MSKLLTIAAAVTWLVSPYLSAATGDYPDTDTLSAGLTKTRSVKLQTTDKSTEKSVRVISIKAKEFEYSPGDIVLKTGEPVKLQLTSEDHRHGFNIPSLKLRADLTPGEVSELTFTPEKAGSVDFFCDVFCGEGHEGMSGKFTVTD